MSSKATCLVLVLVAAAVVTTNANQLNIAVIVGVDTFGVAPQLILETPADSAGGVGGNSSYLRSGGHLFATGLAVHRDRLIEMGGFRVGSVTGIVPQFTVFNIGSAPPRALALAQNLSVAIPRGDYGDFVAIIVTTPRQSGSARLWSGGNAAFGSPCVLLNVGIASTDQFTDPMSGRQADDASYGALVSNKNFGSIPAKLIQGQYAAQKRQTGVALSFAILSGPSESSLAIVADVRDSILSASGSGLEFYGNFSWPVKTSNEAQWNASLTEFALQFLSPLSTGRGMPDVVFFAGLTSEVAASSIILNAWNNTRSPARWRPKYFVLIGGAVPTRVTREYIGAMFVTQWHRSMRGEDLDVKLVAGSTEPFPSNDTLGIQSPEVFSRRVSLYAAYPSSSKVSPIGAAIGHLPSIAIQKAMELECYDVTHLAQCTATRIAAGMRRISSPSAFGRLQFSNGQIVASPFFVTQVNEDLSLTCLAPSDNLNGTLREAESWAELDSILLTEPDPYLYAFACLTSIAGSYYAIILIGWVVLAKKRSKATSVRAGSVRKIVTATLMASATIWTSQAIFIRSLGFQNLTADQSLLGYKIKYILAAALIDLFGSGAVIVLIYWCTTEQEARLSGPKKASKAFTTTATTTVLVAL